MTMFNYLLLLAAFALHTTAMAQRGYSVHHCPVNNLFEVTMFLSWTVVVVYLAIGLLPRLRFLAHFASPGLFAIGVFALMPGLDVPHGVKTELPVAWTSVHAALMSLSYGALGLSSVAALMYLTQERNLKFHKLRAVLSLMPPIQRLEATAARLLLGGLVLMTVALGIGVYVWPTSTIPRLTAVIRRLCGPSWSGCFTPVWRSCAGDLPGADGNSHWGSSACSCLCC